MALQACITRAALSIVEAIDRASVRNVHAILMARAIHPMNTSERIDEAMHSEALRIAAIIIKGSLPEGTP